MKFFSQSLRSELDRQLELVHLEIKDPIHYSEHAINILMVILEKLKTQCIKYKFKNKAEEIEFFREIKPQFTGKLIYYNEIYNIETNKPLASKKAIRKYYNAELLRLKTFFEENLEFYRYYRTGNRYLDNKYFLRGQYDIKLTRDSFCFQANHRCTTSHDYKVAKIIANDSIKGFLEEEIAKLENKSPRNKKSIPLHKTQKWTGSKVSLIELIYALHTEGVFNNGTSALKEVTTFFESVFNVDLGQFNRAFLEIRSRKSDRTKFLNTLKEKLIIRMEEADEN